ncbi:MAG: hydroxymyristoyl-ACP dehydratase [Bacteroidales bacterium]
MLSGLFFDIQSFTAKDPGEFKSDCTFVISLNPTHPIFQGHFPGNPVVPGVCQIQMIMELVETIVNHPLNLVESDNVKFLSMINPVDNPQLECNIVLKSLNDPLISVIASIGAGATVFLKFKGKFEMAAI